MEMVSLSKSVPIPISVKNELVCIQAHCHYFNEHYEQIRECTPVDKNYILSLFHDILVNYTIPIMTYNCVHRVLR